MGWRAERTSFLVWAAAGLLTLVTMIVGAVAWADHQEISIHGKNLESLGAHRDDDHEAIQEMHQDIKDIKNYLLEHK